MKPRSAILRETSDPPIMAAIPRPARKQKPSVAKENAPPISDPNSYGSPAPMTKPSPAKYRSPLPPRPPSSNPLKRKLAMEAVPESSAVGNGESGVQVVVRMRPARVDKEEEDTIVQKLSTDSLAINGQTFTFDSVADTEASQVDIFQLVGAPLVENCMAGFNSSVFAYGQTGSGKTYTMWGPANALLGDNMSNDLQGLTPRVFERLFARINEEQIKYADRQLKYQCHCSFLEIYNEQITDLFDPNQKNLQIREDVKSGIYVENLTEECVRTMADVKQLLIKGLSNRRTGATSINAESSRSHTVFTCVLESRGKSTDGLSSFKTSRINLVDLAGSERQKLTGAAGERLKEAGNINRSLSQLGNLINILAEISQSGKQRHIPYRDSRLTFLLQESLGGNAKLAMVCAISPTQSCKSETFSTLRFAQRAKAIKNKAVVNEVMEDDVNHLREVIRQLRDELQRVKANGTNPVESNGVHSAAWIRRSLHLLKSSLNRPMALPRIDDDSDEEMEIDEEAVEDLCIQVEKQSAARVEDEVKADSQLVDSEIRLSKDPQNCTTGAECTKEHESDARVDGDVKADSQLVDSEIRLSNGGVTKEHESVDTDVKMEEGNSEQDIMVVDGDETAGANIGETSLSVPKCQDLSEETDKVVDVEEMEDDSTPCPQTESVGEELTGIQKSQDQGIGSPKSSISLAVDACNVSPVLKSPTPSLSPRTTSSRKSLRTSSMLTASQKNHRDVEVIQEAIRNSLAKSMSRGSSKAISTRKSALAPTEQLAASIRHGLELIDGHRKSSAFRRSSAFRFSYKPADSRVFFPVTKVDVGVQTSIDDRPSDSTEFLCATCKSRIQAEAENDRDENSNTQLVPVDDLESADKLKHVPKAVQKVLAGAIRREMALEDFCAKQASEIVQLNRLVQQYKHERECNFIIAQTREDKILRLEGLMDGILPTEDFMEEEFVSLKHEHQLLKEKYENHPEVLKTEIELRRAQDELENVRNFCDMGEREVLLEEIQDLRSQLKYYVDSSSSSRRRNHPVSEPNAAPSLGTISDSNNDTGPEDQLEQERRRWTEEESKWISLSEELRLELEASRSLAKKTSRELEIEKNCANELSEAMQMAMQGQARMLEQYADLEEKHMQLLARHRKIQEGIQDVKRAASKAGVRGAESKFINALAAEVSALKVERERERRYLRDENKGLQSQLRDTAEAVQAAGELLIRLREAEEAVALAQNQAMEAKSETEKAYKQMTKLKKKHEKEISTLNDLLAESRLPKEAIPASFDNDVPKYDEGGPQDSSDQKWREEFEPFSNGEDCELPNLTERWFTGYDRCNM